MVSTKPNILKPNGKVMITSQLGVSGAPDHVPPLGTRQVSSPSLLMKRETTRLSTSHVPLAENKRRSHSSIFTKSGAIRSAHVQNRHLDKTMNLAAIRTAPEIREPVHIPGELGMNRTTTSIVDTRKNRWIGEDLRSRIDSATGTGNRLFRNIVPLDKIENGDSSARRSGKDSTFDIYKKIKKDKTIENVSAIQTHRTFTDAQQVELKKTKENKLDPIHKKGETSMGNIPEDVNVTYMDTPMHTHPITTRKTSPLRNLPRNLPSLTFNDVNYDVTHEYEGPYNFDNPRYSIPAARGRPRNSVLPSATAGGQQSCEPAPVVDSLPMTIMDIANASPNIRQSKHGELLFNTDEDVRNFRKLLRNSPLRDQPQPRNISHNLDNLNHKNYCNKEKTRWIVEWIQEVDQTQAREGKWPDTGTGTEYVDGGSKNR